MLSFALFFFFSHSFLCLSQTKYDINIYIHLQNKTGQSSLDHLVFLPDQSDKKIHLERHFVHSRFLWNIFIAVDLAMHKSSVTPFLLGVSGGPCSGKILFRSILVTVCLNRKINCLSEDRRCITTKEWK